MNIFKRLYYKVRWHFRKFNYPLRIVVRSTMTLDKKARINSLINIYNFMVANDINENMRKEALGILFNELDIPKEYIRL
jgi:hypothetical protein